MFKLLIVAQEEISFHLRQWSFYFTILAMPLVFAAIGAAPRLQSAAAEAPLPSIETILTAPSEEIDGSVGYVDHAGLITTVPDSTIGGFKAFVDEESAKLALEQGDIESYYVIAADYLQTGQVVQFSSKPQLLTESDSATRALLRDNLLHTLTDPVLVARLEKPVNFIRNGPPPPVIRFMPADLDLGRLLSAGLVVGLFVYVINVGGNLLLRALHREVRARVLEVMVVSTTPEQFIGGKLLGLMSLTLAQAGITLLAGVVVYGQNPDGSGPASLPLLTLVLITPYLVFGFLAYSGGIMAVAALWPDFRESGALLGVMRLLTLSPLIGGLFVLPNADGALSVALTLFPLTSHLLMPFRMLITEVPLGQWSLGLLFLSAWAALNIWFSMRLFRAHGMLTGRSAAPKVLWQALWR